MQSTETEVWKPVVGYEGLYEVSDHGRVRGLDRLDARGRRWKGRVLKGTRHTMGDYRVVNLAKDGRNRLRFIHRLVLEAFVGTPNPGDQGCHGDGNPTNNHVDNLRWDTSAGNSQDTIRHGRVRNQNSGNTSCKWGHPLAGRNVVPMPTGRACRSCRLARTKAWREGRPFDVADADEYLAEQTGKAQEITVHTDGNN